MTLTNGFSKALALASVIVLGASNIAFAGHHEEKEMAASIVATAAEAGQFNTLLAAAKAAGLADTLANGGPFTVFAPTDEAFAALPEGTVESLLLPENKETLATILKFHLLSGKVGSDALADGIQVDTIAGIKATISAVEGGFNIENAKIVATDIAASNGIIHVIDRVILPPESSAARDTHGDNMVVALINEAIDAGVPLFNDGNTDATAGIYKITAQSLVSFADASALSDTARMRLRQGLDRAAAQHSSRQQAWTLRYALDDVRAEMRGDMMQAANR